MTRAVHIRRIRSASASLALWIALAGSVAWSALDRGTPPVTDLLGALASLTADDPAAPATEPAGEWLADLTEGAPSPHRFSTFALAEERGPGLESPRSFARVEPLRVASPRSRPASGGNPPRAPPSA